MKNFDNILEEDLFNLFIIYNLNHKCNYFIKMNTLMKSFGKYKERFPELYSNVELKTNEFEIPFINLNPVYKKLLENKIIFSADDSDKITIVCNEEYFKLLESDYDEQVKKSFADLMFFINNDLEYGIDGWQLLLEEKIKTKRKSSL